MDMQIWRRFGTRPVLARPLLALAIGLGVLGLLVLGTLPAMADGWVIECADCQSFEWITDRSLALDASNHLHIAYGGGRLNYAYHDGSAWHYETADNSSWLAHTQLSPWRATTPTSVTTTVPMATLSTPTRTAPAGTPKRWMAPAMSARPHPSPWTGTTIPTSATTTTPTMTSSTPTRTVPAGTSRRWTAPTPGGSTSIALDGSDYPHIGYFDYDNDSLKYAYRTTAPAAAARYVDLNGSCNSLTPCYTTISAGVAAATGGDTIYVFPGTYAESVDLDTMSLTGNICLVTVDGSGTPTPGTATIDPGAAGGPGTGAAITSWDFYDNVTVDGFNVTSPDDDGIDIVTYGDKDTAISKPAWCLAKSMKTNSENNKSSSKDTSNSRPS